MNPKPVTIKPAPLTPREKWLGDPRHPRFERLEEARLKASQEPKALDPITEQQWALRLTHLLKTGQLPAKTRAHTASHSL